MELPRTIRELHEFLETRGWRKGSAMGCYAGPGSGTPVDRTHFWLSVDPARDPKALDPVAEIHTYTNLECPDIVAVALDGAELEQTSIQGAAKWARDVETLVRILRKAPRIDLPSFLEPSHFSGFDSRDPHFGWTWDQAGMAWAASRFLMLSCLSSAQMGRRELLEQSIPPGDAVVRAMDLVWAEPFVPCAPPNLTQKDKRVGIQLLDAWLDPYFTVRVAALPGVEWEAPVRGRVRFRFDHGRGLLAPRVLADGITAHLGPDGYAYFRFATIDESPAI